MDVNEYNKAADNHIGDAVSAKYTENIDHLLTGQAPAVQYYV